MKIVNQQTLLSRGCTEREGWGGGLEGGAERESDRGESTRLNSKSSSSLRQTDRARERGECDRETERERRVRESDTYLT